MSASLDDELDLADRALVADHVATCPECARRVRVLDQPSATTGSETEALGPSRLSAVERRWLAARWPPRMLLAALGAALVILAVPLFVGADVAAEGRHGARHVATWQAGFGIGLVIAACRSRFGEALLALAASIGALTALATAIDVINGHRGPLAELVHLVELGGIVLLWWLAPPHLRPSRPRRRPADAEDVPSQPRRLASVDAAARGDRTGR